jgi:rubredoxin
VTKILKEARDAYTAYMCVLCGSVYSSRDYHWGSCGGTGDGSKASRCDWSCPVCGGVVVEYARVPEGEKPDSYVSTR